MTGEGAILGFDYDCVLPKKAIGAKKAVNSLGTIKAFYDGFKANHTKDKAKIKLVDIAASTAAINFRMAIKGSEYEGKVEMVAATHLGEIKAGKTTKPRIYDAIYLKITDAEKAKITKAEQDKTTQGKGKKS